MAIVINGSGTVTGISVGGLPDGIVDAGTLATDSVDSAELIDGAVDNSHMAAMAASKLTGALPAISGASLTGIVNNAGTAGFQVKDSGSWVTFSAATNIVLSGECFDTDGVYNTSTGFFTAPATGVYLFYATLYIGWSDSSSGYTFAKNNSYTGVHGHGDQYGVYFSQSDSSDCMISMQIVIPLSASDTICLKAATQSDLYKSSTYWGGVRLK